MMLECPKKRQFTKVTLNLTPRLADALDAACQDYEGDRNEIATAALEEWLGKRGFLK